MTTDFSHAASLSGPQLVRDPVADLPTETVVPLNEELFIRKAFELDPGKGCELLFREYYGPLCSHAIRFVYSREVARDLVSDVFYTFLQKELYRQITASYRAYLYTAVRHRSLNYLQREFCHESGLMDLESAELDQQALSTASQTPEDIMNYDELLHRVEEVICRMSPQNQKVFMMNRFEGKKYQLIAEELQITLKTVEAHMSKALASLRKALRPDSVWLMILGYWLC